MLEGILRRLEAMECEQANTVLDDVLQGRVDPAVSHIHELWLTIRPDYEHLAQGDRTQWRNAVHCARDLMTRDRNRLVLPALEPLTLGEIDTRFRCIPRPMNSKAQFFIVHGVDALTLALSPRAANAIQQVASQFNFWNPRPP